MSRSDLTDIDVTVKAETDKAWLVIYDEDKDPVWIPKSQGELVDGTLTIPEWLALEKDML